MDNLFKEIGRVRRRLAFERFLGILGWCWFAALVAAAAVVAAARFWPLASTTGIRDWHWLAGFLAAGLIVAIAWTMLTVVSSIRTALEIDRRCGLKERVSSTLAMTAADRASEAGQALIADADARLRRSAVLEQFPVCLPRHLLLPLAPAALVLAAMIFWPPAVKQVAAADQQADRPPPVAVKKSMDDLQQRLAQLRKQDEKKEGLKDATDLLLQKVEDGARDATLQTREKALIKLNDLARELQDRHKQLGGKSESLWRQMDKVQTIDQSPADGLAKALAKSDFQKAARQLEQLKKELDGKALNEAQKQELAKQIDQVKQKLDTLAKEQKQAKADLEKQLQQMKQDQAESGKQAGKQAGDARAAQKLEDEIQKLQQQGPRMECLKNLASKLGQCASQMKQGQGQQAAQSMQEAMEQMQQLAQDQKELKTLDSAMQMLADARRQMNCEKCGGQGCKECQGQGAGESEDQMVQNGGGKGDKEGEPGPGLGGGRGDGPRPIAKADARFYDSRVSQKVGKGAGQVTGLTDGPNLKNQAEADIQQSTSAVEHGSTDPLSGQRLPKKQSEHAREYFDSFREGK